MIRHLAGILTLVLVATAGSLQAQNPAARPGGPPGAPPAGAGQLRGTAVEAESGQAVPGVSVAVRSARDSSIVAGAFAREDGTFRVMGLQPGSYFARISAIGFAPHNTEPFSITPAAATADVGTIRLTRSAILLEEVQVTAERSAMVIEPDRNAYRAQDVAPAASNASDVLAATPSVEVDADGKVSLRGNENVAVQINGRPAPIRGAQLGAYLKQLPASVIDRVEVVPTPSARHDPEGMAGIINIVMKQNTDLGLSYGFTLGASPQQRYNASGNAGYQAGKLTLFGSYGFNADQRPVTGINERERFDALGASVFLTEQDVDGENSFGGHNVNFTADYRLSQRNTLSNALAFNLRRFGDESRSAWHEFDGDRNPVDRFDRVRDTDNRGLMLDYTLAFKRTIEPRRHELGSEIRFNYAKDDDATDLWRQGPPGSSTAPYERERNEVDASTRTLTAQLDYTRPLAERSKLETGYRGNARWMERDYDVRRDALGSGDWEPSPFSNTFEMDETTHAVYGVVSHGLGKFELQGGLRGEYTDREFSLTSAGESYPHSYGSLFPSGVVSYQLSEGQQVKASYSRRIRRPNTQELNPFPVFFDAQNVFIGNPDLSPEYTDAFELAYNQQGRLGTFQVTPFYRRTSNIIRFIIDTDAEVDGRPVSTVSFQNLATGNSWGTDLNGSLRLGPRLNGFAGFNVFKMVTEGGSETSLSSDAVTWSARVNATTQLTEATTLQGFYFYRAPMNVESGRFSAQQMASFTVRQRLNPRSTIALRVSDPFNTMGFRVEAGDQTLWQITERRFGVRALHLTYQYTFGQAPRVRQPQPQQEPQGGGFPGG